MQKTILVIFIVLRRNSTGLEVAPSLEEQAAGNLLSLVKDQRLVTRAKGLSKNDPKARHELTVTSLSRIEKMEAICPVGCHDASRRTNVPFITTHIQRSAIGAFQELWANLRNVTCQAHYLQMHRMYPGKVH